ncbi:IMPACT family protein [Ureaplasma ceti]|uniref:YigZ family protein n=1 Tax=Ureaplasma ceti TaxID=3119530 RepID=A0ABP9U885_9BACT
MKIIAQEHNNLYEIKKSKFLGFNFYVESVADCEAILNDLRTQFYDATHICYAYILNESQSVQKYSDDGEPSGTAGYPLLSLLLKNELTNILVVVVRYYGGIKLGAGGLLRAYTKTISSLFQECELLNFVKYYYYEIQFDYNDTKTIEYWINSNHYTILDKQYGEDVIFEIKCDVEITPHSLLKKLVQK